jgi:hypothetical protein
LWPQKLPEAARNNAFFGLDNVSQWLDAEQFLFFQEKHAAAASLPSKSAQATRSHVMNPPKDASTRPKPFPNTPPASSPPPSSVATRVSIKSEPLLDDVWGCLSDDDDDGVGSKCGPGDIASEPIIISSDSELEIEGDDDEDEFEADLGKSDEDIFEPSDSEDDIPPIVPPPPKRRRLFPPRNEYESYDKPKIKITTQLKVSEIIRVTKVPEVWPVPDNPAETVYLLDLDGDARRPKKKNGEEKSLGAFMTAEVHDEFAFLSNLIFIVFRFIGSRELVFSDRRQKGWERDQGLGDNQ